MSSAWISDSLKCADQVGLGVVRFADDLDDLVDVEQDRLPAFEDVDALLGGGQAVARAPFHGRQAEPAPFGNHANTARPGAACR